MLILAFDTAEDAESGGALEAKARFEALINPETYTLEYKVKTADGQGQGTSGAQIKFEYTLPEELTFDFLFDNTGLIDGKPKPDGVFDDVDAFRKLLTEYQGDSHEPYHLKLVWGNLDLQGPSDRGRHHLQAVQPRRPADPRGRPRSSSRARSRTRSAPRWRIASPPTSPTGARSSPATRCRSCASRSTATRGTTCSSPTSTGLDDFRRARRSGDRSCSRRSPRRRRPMSDTSVIPTPATPDVCSVSV